MSRLFHRAQKAFVLFVLQPLASAYMAVEYFIVLSFHRTDIAKAEYVSPLWFWSFGHQAIDPHMLAMRFRGKKMLVLISDYKNFNPYLVGTFGQYVDMCYLHHTWCMRLLRPVLKAAKLKQLKLKVLAFFLRCIGSRAVIIPEYHEHMGTPMEGIFITERIRLFQEHADMPVVPLQEPIEEFRQALRKSHPELADKWFVTLHLRNRPGGHAHMRNTDAATVRSVVERIPALGGFVFCCGDIDPHDVYPGMPGVIGYNDVECNRAVTDLFIITQCRFLVGPPSGPVAIGISFNTPMLITNDPYYYHSGSRANEIVLYKKLREKSTGRFLTAHELFSEPIVSFRADGEFWTRGLEHVDNSADEIAEALEEMIHRYVLHDDLVKPEHQALYERFRNLLPKQSLVYQTPSRPALSYLQRLEW